MEEKITYRLANDADTDAINHFYNSVYKSNRNKEKFEWEFHTAPAGKSIYVLAESNNKIVGTQCVIPYYIITHENQTLLSGKSEDTLVSAEHRGKQIFEKMYALLIEECKRQKILFIWGFTYAAKPFLKLGFEIPYRSKMGILVLKPFASAAYLSSLSSKNTSLDKFKILGLAWLSWSKALKLKISSKFNAELDSPFTALNSGDFNYLHAKGSFGLKLDNEFLDYRVASNPYNKTYKTFLYKKNGKPAISILYTLTSQGIGYIIHVYAAENISKNEMQKALKSVLASLEQKNCHTLRFWGFDHNSQNASEIELLSKSGFTFINRGISFVWLNLSDLNTLKPQHFVLSRMASQGTD